MLIPDFIFVRQQDLDHQLTPYSLKLHLHIGTYADYSRFTCTACSRRFGTTSLERCLVLSPGDGIKPVIYCTSIRQRERTCFRQLNCRPDGLWSLQPSLRMLTYHFYPLSNPVNPIFWRAFGAYVFKPVYVMIWIVDAKVNYYFRSAKFFFFFFLIVTLRDILHVPSPVSSLYYKMRKC